MRTLAEIDAEGKFLGEMLGTPQCEEVRNRIVSRMVELMEESRTVEQALKAGE